MPLWSPGHPRLVSFPFSGSRRAAWPACSSIICNCGWECINMIKTPFPGKPLRWWDLIPVMGFVVCALAFYPGIMTPDTLDQLAQANAQAFNDWHPPMMAWLWSGLNRVFPAASGFLFFDLFLLWFGLYRISRSIDPRYAPYVYLLGFLPFVINISGVIWKDVATAYALLWASIALLQPPSRGRFVLFSLFIF